MAAEYVFFRRAFAALDELGLAGAALTLYLLESLLVVVFALALLSFVASGLWVYYRARDTRFLLAAPLSTSGLFALRTIETWLLTSWALGVVAAPALLALGTAYGRDLEFYAEAVAILALFGMMAAAGGVLVTVATGLLVRRTRTRAAAVAVLTTLVVALVLLIGQNVVPSAADFYAVFEPGMLNGKPASIKFIEAKSARWPSHPFAAQLYVSATGRRAGSPATRAALVLAPLLTLLVAATLGRRLYARVLPGASESVTIAGAAPGTGPARSTAFPRWLRGPVGALVERDLVVIARSPHELGRAAFIALLLLLYTSFIVVAPLREVADRPAAVARLLFFTVVASGYFLTAFGLRFVFPSMSLEGRAAWVFFSAPIALTRLVLAKAVLFATLLSATVVPVAMLGVVRLTGSPALLATMAALLVMLAVTTTSLLLAVGSAWPDFRETNPDSLSTSGGALAATVACLAYVTWIGWTARAAALAAADHASVLPWLAAAALTSVALSAGALVFAQRRLPALEVG